jgi:hypothetical protein
VADLKPRDAMGFWVYREREREERAVEWSGVLPLEPAKAGLVLWGRGVLLRGPSRSHMREGASHYSLLGVDELA